jgi:mannose-6-phosphate isomerase-like protein (cupin superfamily)
MHVTIFDTQPEIISDGIEERTLLNYCQTQYGNLCVKHHVLSKGEVFFTDMDSEFQHYIISGCAQMGSTLLHGDTAVFVPGNSRFGEDHKHSFKHTGEGELRILTAIYKLPRPNFRWSKVHSKNLYEVVGGFTGMYAQQLFTEEEHALIGARRMHSIDVQTHPPLVELPLHRNPEEFGYILRGYGEVYSDGKWTKVSPGSIVYTREGVPHSIKNTSHDNPLQYVAFEFTKQDESWDEMGVSKM